MLLYVIKDEDLKRTILGATLEWAELVRSDKRIHEASQAHSGRPIHASAYVNNSFHHLPLLAIHDSQSTTGRR